MMKMQLFVEGAAPRTSVHPRTSENPANAGTKRHLQARRTAAWLLVKTDGEALAGKLVPLRRPITLRQALRVKSAEYWMEHGQPNEALRGLEKLPQKAWNHPWVARVRVAAVKALREMSGQAHAE
jgi:hypothetical protein